MKRYSIKEVERLTGIKAHNLRIWEQRYNLIVPHRTETNIRYYDEAHLRLLLNVSLLLIHGYKISTISSFSEDEMATAIRETYLRSVGSPDNLSAQTHINDLFMSMLDFDEHKFEKVFANSILKRGVERTLSEVIYPFLLRMSLMWRVGEMDNGQEQFMYYLIRQKVIVAIDAIPVANHDAQTFLLFLPESEYRDLLILLYIYLLKIRGKRIINLGQNISIDILKNICKGTQPDVLMTFFSSPASLSYIQKYVSRLAQTFPKQEILVAGGLEHLSSVKCPNNVQLILSLDRFSEMMDRPIRIAKSN